MKRGGGGEKKRAISGRGNGGHVQGRREAGTQGQGEAGAVNGYLQTLVKGRIFPFMHQDRIAFREVVVSVEGRRLKQL